MTAVSPMFFTKGSKWRFHTKRWVNEMPHAFKVGDEITVTANIDSQSKVIPFFSKECVAFCRTSDFHRFIKRDDVTGTVHYDSIKHYVELVEHGAPDIYYLKCPKGMYYDTDGLKTRNMDEARIFSRQTNALQTMFLLNISKIGWSNYYTVMKYNIITETEEEVVLPDIAIKRVMWVHEKVSRRDARTVITSTILNDLEAENWVVVIARGVAFSELDALVVKHKIKRVLVDNRWMFMGDKLDDAILLKMKMSGKIEVVDIAKS